MKRLEAKDFENLNYDLTTYFLVLNFKSYTLLCIKLRELNEMAETESGLFSRMHLKNTMLNDDEKIVIVLRHWSITFIIEKVKEYKTLLTDICTTDIIHYSKSSDAVEVVVNLLRLSEIKYDKINISSMNKVLNEDEINPMKEIINYLKYD